MELQSTFNKIYANLPMSIREEVIVVVNGEPMTWNAVWLEVRNNTEIGLESLQKLYNLGILKADADEEK